MPNDVHYTLSYHERSEDVNIHLTRNIGKPNDKPKIELVKINKKILEKIGPYSMMSILNKFLRPIDLTPYLNAELNVKFIPIELLQQGESAEQMQSLLLDGFKPISKIKKRTRLKVKGSVEDKLIDVCTSQEMLTSVEKLAIDLSESNISNCRGGIFRLENKAIAIIKYNDSWYELTNEVSPLELLSAVVGEDWAKIIIRYAKRALVKIRRAKSYQEIKIWNDPIVLVANPDFEKVIDDLQKNSDQSEI